MYMIAAERVSPPSPSRAAASRSPFVQLRELLCDSPPAGPVFTPHPKRPEGGLRRGRGAVSAAPPANPQGSVAPASYLTRLIELARRFGFVLFSDECYSEIYTQHAPASALEVAG